MNPRNSALLLAFLAALIYGVSYTVAKDVMPLYIKPYAFIILRVLGATILFWAISFFAKKEKIERQDYIRIFLAAIFGAAFNILTFFKGLSLTSPINASVIMLTVPIVVLLLSTIILKEKINLKKVLGIAIGLCGAFILIVYGQSINSGENPLLGNFLVFVNASLYSFYLIIVKRLTDKYHPLTFMKWLFLLGIFICLPFGYQELIAIDWPNLPFEALWKIAFVIIGTTFCTYLFNIFALTQLKASTVSAFIYVQPLIGILFAVTTGQDSLTTVKIIAACLVLLGVYLASRKPKIQ